MKTAIHIIFLFAGCASVILPVVSCGSCKGVEKMRKETMLTQQTDSMTLIESIDGNRQRRMETPLMERYEYAAEPYMEFRKGVYVENYRNDSIQGDLIESTIVADYAINYEKRKVWEARGNVVVTSYSNNRTLMTEQLFWNERTGRIYSYVESTVIDDGVPMHMQGFESDDKFDQWEAMYPIGKIAVEPTPGEKSDSTAVESPAEEGAETI